MTNTRIIYMHTAGTKTYSILRYEAAEGVRYSVSESGTRLVWIFTCIKEAMIFLMKRSFNTYQLHAVKIDGIKGRQRMTKDHEAIAELFNQTKGCSEVNH